MPKVNNNGTIVVIVYSNYPLWTDFLNCTFVVTYVLLDTNEIALTVIDILWVSFYIDEDQAVEVK